MIYWKPFVVIQTAAEALRGDRAYAGGTSVTVTATYALDETAELAAHLRDGTKLTLTLVADGDTRDVASWHAVMTRELRRTLLRRARIDADRRLAESDARAAS